MLAGAFAWWSGCQMGVPLPWVCLEASSFLIVPWVSARFRRAKTPRLKRLSSPSSFHSVPLGTASDTWACGLGSSIRTSPDSRRRLTRHITRPLAISTPAFALWVAPARALVRGCRVLSIPLRPRTSRGERNRRLIESPLIANGVRERTQAAKVAARSRRQAFNPAGPRSL